MIRGTRFIKTLLGSEFRASGLAVGVGFYLSIQGSPGDRVVALYGF